MRNVIGSLVKTMTQLMLYLDYIGTAVFVIQGNGNWKVAALILSDSATFKRFARVAAHFIEMQWVKVIFLWLSHILLKGNY